MPTEPFRDYVAHWVSEWCHRRGDETAIDDIAYEFGEEAVTSFYPDDHDRVNPMTLALFVAAMRPLIERLRT